MGELVEWDAEAYNVQSSPNVTKLFCPAKSGGLKSRIQSEPIQEVNPRWLPRSNFRVNCALLEDEQPMRASRLPKILTRSRL